MKEQETAEREVPEPVRVVAAVAAPPKIISFDWKVPICGPRLKLHPGESVKFVSPTSVTILRADGPWPFVEPDEVEVGSDGKTLTAIQKEGTYKYSASGQNEAGEDTTVSGQIEIDPPRAFAGTAEPYDLDGAQLDPEQAMMKCFEQLRTTVDELAGKKPDWFFPNGVTTVIFKAGYAGAVLEFTIKGPETDQKTEK